MEKTNIKDFEKYVGCYFFWEDNWNAEYEGFYVKSIDVENEALNVEKFHATESFIVYDTEDIIYPLEQDGYNELEDNEVTKEDYWERVTNCTINYYEVYKDLNNLDE